MTNPTVLGVLLLFFIALTRTGEFYRIVSYEAILLISFVALPLAYVYFRKRGLEPGVRLISDPTSFLRNHPKDILVMGLLFGLPCLGILIFLGAPAALVAALASLLGISFVVALINLIYRVSYHLAALTAILISAVMIWGPVFLIILGLIPLVSWAKHRMHEHTIAQMIMATILSTVATLTIFYYSGLI